MVEIRMAFSLGRSQIPVTQPYTGLKMTGNRFFRYLLPRDEDAKGLKSRRIGMTLPELEQCLIGLGRSVAGTRGKRFFQLDGGVPVGTQFGLCLLKGGACGEGRIELHAVLHE